MQGIQEGEGWRVTRYFIPREHQVSMIDVMPVNDLKEHFTGDECWCNPKITYENTVPVITHNSQDLREKKDAPKFF